MTATVDVVRTSRRARSRRAHRVTAALAAAALGAFVVRVTLGDYTVTVPDAVRIVLGADIPGASFVLMESKLPRAVLSVVAGSALAVAGAMMQDLLRNPLASPDVLGVSGGAATAALFCIVVLGRDGAVVTLAALAGALIVAAVLLVLGRGPRGGEQQMIVVGVGCSALLVAATHWVLLRADVYRLSEAMTWLSGSVAQGTWPDLGRLTVLVVVVGGGIGLVRGDLRVLQLGDDLASGLGVPVRARRGAATVLLVLLVAGTCATCGPIAFVALLSGPVGRRLAGGRTRLVDIALVGAITVLLADHVAAYLAPGGANLPVGVVTGLVGAPFLLWLLATRSRVEMR